jgi:hypothetical protein
MQGQTYSAACAGFRIACIGSTVEPSEISAKAKRFCFRTERMKPFTLTSWSSKLQVPPLLAWRIWAHREIEGRVAELLLSLATDVAKDRRHICIAGEVEVGCSEIAGKGKLIVRLAFPPELNCYDRLTLLICSITYV